VLTWFVRKRVAIPLGVSGMAQAMDGASGATRGRLALITTQSKTSRFADVVNFPSPADTTGLHIADLGDAFRSPVVTPARVLLISGTLDFNTPPYRARSSAGARRTPRISSSRTPATSRSSSRTTR
jgi:hypothetical protein